MKNLPNVTLICVDTVNYGKAIDAISQSLNQIQPAKTIWFTDIHMKDSFDVVQIPTVKSKDEYSHFIIKKLGEYIKTSHVLVIQADGYVLDGDAWSDEFLQYDYIGAPWLYPDGRNVGNGGFSLRSAKLQKILMEDPYIEYIYPEDEAIGRLYRHYLEKKYDIKFAPEELAHKFAYELNQPTQPTFGFHGKFHPPYRKQVILKRTAAMGDILMMEPVMEHFYLQGYQVILDVPTSPINFFALFERHNFPVVHVSQVDAPNAKVINLDMAYEVKPKQLALKSYFEMSGVENPELRNPRLSVKVDATNKLFDKYVVFHVDDTAMTHRNIRGMDWKKMEEWFTKNGYTVIQVGKGEHRIGVKMNSSTLSMLTYIIAGASLFIGADSGPGQIAVACGVKSVLFFGSVNPRYRFADFEKIMVIQDPCPIKKDFCYHETVGVRGVECQVDKKLPPCTVHNFDEVMFTISKFI
jgi:ADP-heptose:LPS heptosyltransferase